MAFLVDIKTSILPMYRSETQILLFDGALAHTCRDMQDFMTDYLKSLSLVFRENFSPNPKDV